jgi:hypothetical protein
MDEICEILGSRSGEHEDDGIVSYSTMSSILVDYMVLYPRKLSFLDEIFCWYTREQLIDLFFLSQNKKKL